MKNEKKWSGVKRTYPVLPVKSEWRKRVDVAKREFLGIDEKLTSAENLKAAAENANVSRLARLFADRKIRKRKLEAEIEQLNIELEALSRLGTAAQDGMEATSIALRGGLTVYESIEPYSMVVDRAAAMRWAKENRHLYLFQLQWQGLNKLVKARLKKNLPPPPGVKVWTKSSWRVLGIGGEKNGDE